MNSETKPNIQDQYDIAIDGAGFQDRLNYSYLLFKMLETIDHLEKDGEMDKAIDVFHNRVAWFQSISDTEDVFKKNWNTIIEQFKNKRDMSYKQQKIAMYRLFSAEFAQMLMRQGLLPRPDKRVYYSCDRTPKTLKEVLE